MSKNIFMVTRYTRRVKLYGKYRPVVNHWRGFREVPWFNVSGAWLEKAGFGVDDRVEITVEDHQLIIKPLSSHGDPSH